MSEDDLDRLARRMMDQYADDAETECLARAFYHRTVHDFTAEAHWRRVAEAVKRLRSTTR